MKRLMPPVRVPLLTAFTSTRVEWNSVIHSSVACTAHVGCRHHAAACAGPVQVTAIRNISRWWAFAVSWRLIQHASAVMQALKVEACICMRSCRFVCHTTGTKGHSTAAECHSTEAVWGQPVQNLGSRALSSWHVGLMSQDPACPALVGTHSWSRLMEQPSCSFRYKSAASGMARPMRDLPAQSGHPRQQTQALQRRCHAQRPPAASCACRSLQ